ncbi:MAG: phospholipase D family protein [Ktedonobacteraceae bacterium]
MNIPDVTVSFVDKALQVLLQAGRDYPYSNLDISVAYISANGALWLEPLFKRTKRKRVVAGLCSINRVNALLRLQDLGVEVYVYPTRPRKVFHPKIYYGTVNSQAWAMIGSSNLTQNGLSLNVERNLFIIGQRHIEPFTSIEAQMEVFRTQAYHFDDDIARKLTEVERRTGKSISDEEYARRLIDVGIQPKADIISTIPDEVQQVAIDTLIQFAQATPLIYAYQMLLLLIMLDYADKNGLLSIDVTASLFRAFYDLRSQLGLRRETDERATVENPNASPYAIRQMLRTGPVPRFERKGLLEVSEDNTYLMINPALLAGITHSLKQDLRELAIRRIAEHYGEDVSQIATIIAESIG